MSRQILVDLLSARRTLAAEKSQNQKADPAGPVAEDSVGELADYLVQEIAQCLVSALAPVSLAPLRKWCTQLCGLPM